MTRTDAGDLARAVLGAAGVHLLALAMLALGTRDWTVLQSPRPSGVVQARVVQPSEAGRILDAQAEARRRQRREQRRAEELQAQRQREAQEQRQHERREAAAERQRRLEAQRLREQLEQRRQRQREQAQQALQEQERRLAEIREQRRAAERRRQQEQQRLQELAAAERQAETQAAPDQPAATAGTGGQADADLRARYIAAIQATVTASWLRPPSARSGLECKVRVVQLPGGEILDATITQPCNADAATQRSIINAVRRTRGLPYRGFEDVFQRELAFVFKYEG